MQRHLNFLVLGFFSDKIKAVKPMLKGLDQMDIIFKCFINSKVLYRLVHYNDFIMKLWLKLK